MNIELKQAAQDAAEAIDWLLKNIRLDAPQLSGKAMGNAEKCASALRAALAPQPATGEREADGLPPIVAGAVFDFAGFMTTRSEVIEVGSVAAAGPVADLVKEWAELRGLDLANAAVLSWQLHITRASLPATSEPVVSRNPFASRCYTMSESHLSGHRLIVGFEKLGDAQDAHEWVTRQGRGDFTHPAPSVPNLIEKAISSGCFGVLPVKATIPMCKAGWGASGGELTFQQIGHIYEEMYKARPLPDDAIYAAPSVPELGEQLKDAISSRDFYRRRCELLQDWQSKMRDPERNIVCDILANGQTLPPDHAGDRYGAHTIVSAPADVVRDAERFRWLRLALADREKGVSHHFCSIRYSEELDEAIDAAMLAA